MQRTKLKNAFRIVFVIMLAAIATLGVYDFIIPQSISVFSDFSNNSEISYDEYFEEIAFPFCTVDAYPSPGETRVSAGEGEKPIYVSTSASAKIFGTIPLKKVNVDIYKEIELYPGGMPFGVKLYTDGVIVVGISSVEAESGKKTPATDGGLRERDVIKAINGKTVNTTDEVSSAIEQSGGKTITFTVNRNGKELTFDVTPILSKTDGIYKAGIWIRDSAAGIGTITFISPTNGAFAGLGHGICDVDSGELLPLRKGTVADVTISGVTKGQVGSPGELKGYFVPGKIGSLIGNTACGVYGILSDKPDVSHSEALKIGLKDELKIGEAKIYCTVNDKLDSYDVEIVKIGSKETEQKNFVIKIVDKRLLEATGGIVQGM